MPANLPPEWYKVKEKYDNAKNKTKKVKHLEELLSVTPTHKGTENLRAQLKRKLSKLKKKQPQIKKGGKTYTVKKEGDLQISIVGLPNSGKSTFLKKWTSAEPKIAKYPYTTKEPEVGMFKWKDLEFQLVEIPSTFDREILGVARNSDLIIFLIGPFMGEEKQREKLEEIAEEFNPEKILWIDYSEKNIGEKIWKKFDLIRIYTKTKGKKKDKPIVMKEKSTVKDAARKVHKDFLEFFKFARIYGNSAKFDGERVGLDHVLKDGDIVEIHTKS